MSRAGEMAVGRWPGLLGQWLDERTLAGRHGACPMCGGRDRFRFDDLEGAGTWICSHCGAGDGFHLLQHLLGCDFQAAARYVAERVGNIEARPIKPGRSECDIRAALALVWSSSVPLEAGDPVMRYLTRRCGITNRPRGLRHHPSLRHVDGDGVVTSHPAMVAQVLGADGKPVTIHRTWLTTDGNKAAVDVPRKMMTPTSKLGNAAIRLAPIEDGWLGVAEGIETALAASAKHRVPVWSCCAAGLLKQFRPPPDVKLLCIFGDNDSSFTGQAAAYELARAVAVTGIECRVIIPETVGTDWADKTLAHDEAQEQNARQDGGAPEKHGHLVGAHAGLQPSTL